MLKEMSDAEIAEMNSIRWWHRIPIGTYKGKTIITPGEVDHGNIDDHFPIPDVKGKSVLDIGAWDGLFSFQCEQRGASEVMAVDVAKENGGNWGGNVGFRFAQRILESRVRFSQYDIQNKNNPSWDLCTLNEDAFDIVLCFGVLYHLRNPLVAIENLCALTKPGGKLIIETAVIPEHTTRWPTWALRRNWEGDKTNYYYPNESGLWETLKINGFKNMDRVWACPSGNRKTFICERCRGVERALRSYFPIAFPKNTHFPTDHQLVIVKE